MDEKSIRDLLIAIGATGELAGQLRDSFMRNGFSREEAAILTGLCISQMYKIK